MDKDLPGMKRVLRSTTAGKVKTSGPNDKRPKTKEKKRKEVKDDLNKDDVESTGDGRKQRPVRAKSAVKQEQTKKTSAYGGAKVVWSIFNNQQCAIQTPEDKSIGWITGIYLLDSGEIVMTDFYNKRLKKLDPVNNKVKATDLPSLPVGMCYIGENIIAISLVEQLQFADVTGDMQLTKTVDLEFDCKGLTCHDENLYLVNENTVFSFTHDGRLEREVYKHESKEAYFQTIVVSSDGRLIYIASWNIGLVTIDNKGNHLFTLFDQDIKAPFGLCLDMNGNVLLCLTCSDSIIQVSSDGKRRLGDVIKKTEIGQSPRSLFFDVKTNSLIVGCGGSFNIYILKLV